MSNLASKDCQTLPTSLSQHISPLNVPVKGYRSISKPGFQLSEPFVSLCAELEMLCHSIVLLWLMTLKNGCPSNLFWGVFGFFKNFNVISKFLGCVGIDLERISALEVSWGLEEVRCRSSTFPSLKMPSALDFAKFCLMATFLCLSSLYLKIWLINCGLRVSERQNCNILSFLNTFLLLSQLGTKPDSWTNIYNEKMTWLFSASVHSSSDFPISCRLCKSLLFGYLYVSILLSYNSLCQRYTRFLQSHSPSI